MTINFDVAKQEMERLSDELHDGEYAPNASEFMHYKSIVISRRAIYHHFGNWENFAEWCGLTLGSRSYYFLSAQLRGGSVAAMMRQAESDEATRTENVAHQIERQRNTARAAMELPMGVRTKNGYQERKIYCWRTRRWVTVLAATLV